MIKLKEKEGLFFSKKISKIIRLQVHNWIHIESMINTFNPTNWSQFLFLKTLQLH